MAPADIGAVENLVQLVPVLPVFHRQADHLANEERGVTGHTAMALVGKFFPRHLPGTCGTANRHVVEGRDRPQLLLDQVV